MRWIATLILAATLAACEGATPHTQSDGYLILLAQKHVMFRVATPSSAAFAKDVRPNVIRNADGTVSVIGQLDAENLHGARVRYVYNCMMEMKDGRWKAFNVIILPRSSFQQSQP